MTSLRKKWCTFSADEEAYCLLLLLYLFCGHRSCSREHAQTLFFRVLSERGLALRFFLQDETREHTSTSSRRLRTEYHHKPTYAVEKAFPGFKSASKYCSGVPGSGNPRYPESREPAVPGVPGTRHSKPRGSPETNPGRLHEKLPGSRYRFLVPGRNPKKVLIVGEIGSIGPVFCDFSEEKVEIPSERKNIVKLYFTLLTAVNKLCYIA